MLPWMSRLALFALCTWLAACASARETTDDSDDTDADSDTTTDTDDDDDSPSIDAALPDAAPDAGNSACALQLAAATTAIETAAAGWTHAVMDGASAAGWPLDEWQGGQASAGPGSCRTGGHCWASPLNKNYTSCERAELVSPAVNLSACAGEDVSLVLWTWFDFWNGTVSGKAGTWFDGGFVEVQGATNNWMAITPAPAYPGALAINGNIGSYACVSPDSFYAHSKPGFVGMSAGWREESIVLPQAVLTPSFRVRFVFASGVSFADNDAEGNRSHTRPGWFIDDLSFTLP